MRKGGKDRVIYSGIRTDLIDDQRQYKSIFHYILSNSCGLDQRIHS